MKLLAADQYFADILSDDLLDDPDIQTAASQYFESVAKRDAKEAGQEDIEEDIDKSDDRENKDQNKEGLSQGDDDGNR